MQDWLEERIQKYDPEQPASLRESEISLLIRAWRTLDTHDGIIFGMPFESLEESEDIDYSKLKEILTKKLEAWLNVLSFEDAQEVVRECRQIGIELPSDGKFPRSVDENSKTSLGRIINYLNPFRADKKRSKPTALFELIYQEDGKPDKDRWHDDAVAKLRGTEANKAGIEFLDAYREVSNLLFVLLAGTLPPDSTAQFYAALASSVSPDHQDCWFEKELRAWQAFCKNTGFDLDEDLGIQGKDNEWYAWKESYKTQTEANLSALEIGNSGNGDSIFVLPNGEVWMTHAEVGEVPFLKIFSDLEKTVEKVNEALIMGKLIRESEDVWRWGDCYYEYDQGWCQD